jgi:SSS family solute:Na+ symporter
MNLGIAAIIYLLLSSLVGVYVSRRVDSAKGFALANRSLPVYVSTATVFATWFGSESILGIPGSFLEHGIVGMMSDPLSASLYLLLVGMFIARHFYRMNVTTIADFLKNRYDNRVGTFLGFCIAASYMGWIAAQVIAFGFVVKFLSGGMVSEDTGKVIAAIVVVLYTFKGGMMSVAYNDFVQACMIVFGLAAAIYSIHAHTDLEFNEVINFALSEDRFEYKYNEEYPSVWHVLGGMLAIMCGSLPQQDTYQRITSSDSENSAVASTILGGLVYFVITMLPIYIVLTAVMTGFKTADDNSETFLIHYIAEKNNFYIQVLFFGALLAAILSTMAGTTLASSILLSENVIGSFTKFGTTVTSLRICFVITAIIVLIIALTSSESIHSLVVGAGKIALVSAFWPLVFGVFVKTAKTSGALYSSILGAGSWVTLESLSMLDIYHTGWANELVGFAISLAVITFDTVFLKKKR